MSDLIDLRTIREVRVAQIIDKPERAVLIINGEHHFELSVRDLAGLAKQLTADAHLLAG